MSAPAGLAVSKIIYPEVEEPETRDLSKMQHQEDRLSFPFTVTFFSLDKSTVLVENALFNKITKTGENMHVTWN